MLEGRKEIDADSLAVPLEGLMARLVVGLGDFETLASC